MFAAIGAKHKTFPGLFLKVQQNRALLRVSISLKPVFQFQEILVHQNISVLPAPFYDEVRYFVSQHCGVNQGIGISSVNHLRRQFRPEL